MFLLVNIDSIMEIHNFKYTSSKAKSISVYVFMTLSFYVILKFRWQYCHSRSRYAVENLNSSWFMTQVNQGDIDRFIGLFLQMLRSGCYTRGFLVCLEIMGSQRACSYTCIYISIRTVFLISFVSVQSFLRNLQIFVELLFQNNITDITKNLQGHRYY